MKKLSNINHLTMVESQNCKVLYKQAEDEVLMMMGCLSLSLDVRSFMLMHEMMRKVVARLVMQTNLNHQEKKGCC